MIVVPLPTAVMSSFSSSCPRDSALFIDTFLSSISSLSSHHLQTLLKTFITTIHQLTTSSTIPSKSPSPRPPTNNTFVSLPPSSVSTTPLLTIYHSKTKLPIIRILSSTSLKKPKHHAASSPSSPSSSSSSSSSSISSPSACDPMIIDDTAAAAATDSVHPPPPSSSFSTK